MSLQTPAERHSRNGALWADWSVGRREVEGMRRRELRERKGFQEEELADGCLSAFSPRIPLIISQSFLLLAYEFYNHMCGEDVVYEWSCRCYYFVFKSSEGICPRNGDETAWALALTPGEHGVDTLERSNHGM